MTGRTAMFLCILAGTVFAQDGGDKPDWLDTIAPVITVSPLERYQSKVFLIELKCDEQAVIRYRVGHSGDFSVYKNPLTVSEDGRIVVFYRAEDMFGNVAGPDSVEYILDTRSPRFELKPLPGRYRQPVTLSILANEPCRYFLRSSPDEPPGSIIHSGMVITDSLIGYICAYDSAGNRTSTGLVQYRVDTSRVSIAIFPRPGIFNTPRKIGFSVSGKAQLFYSFDPVAPPEWFVQYEKPVELPSGLTVVRYFAKDNYGWQSSVEKATFVLDTVAPRLRVRHHQGPRTDTLELLVRENSVIRYEFGGSVPDDNSPVYSNPLVVPHESIIRLKAYAQDSAGNQSALVSFEFKYDTIPPVIQLSHLGGTFREPVQVQVSANEKCRYFYTVDGSEPGAQKTPTTGLIVVSRQGETRLRVVGVDMAGNVSNEVSATFYIDNEPAEVKTHISGDIDNNEFTVSFETEPGATIYFERGNTQPTRSSPHYTEPFKLRLGDIVRYFTVDKAGNVGDVIVMDDLRKPMVSAYPVGGLHNRKLKIVFLTSLSSHVYYRLLPDTAYIAYTDTIRLNQSGTYVLEYYSETGAGLKSAVRRETYMIDISAPSVSITVKKGIGDTAFVLFESDENASIYYTVDGTNPMYSRTTRMVGNKLTQSRARIKVRRNQDLKLAFFAEDAAGNQSSLAVLDVFKPRAVPNVPAGPETVYDHILSVSLNAFDQSVIYFSHHGKTPTVDSAVYQEPLTLIKSDTLCAFVIDASGYIGKVDTFVYLIDLPPAPHLVFTPSPDSLLAGKPVFFDASGSIDNETAHDLLQYRWDFEGDGKWDTKRSAASSQVHTYTTPGLYRPTVEVRDERGRTATENVEISVRDLCKPGMVYVVDRQGNNFCMDLYEWPNLPHVQPLTDVSWVEAKMYCLEAGKRLCTAVEWENACRGRSPLEYPYGSQYESGRCATAGESAYPSGTFANCGEGFGLRDMVGNVWEWVEDKTGDYPLMMGGAWMSGQSANCGLRSEGTVGTKSRFIGFRCCK